MEENKKYSTVYMPSYLKDIIKDISQRYGMKQIDILSNALKNYKNSLDERQPFVISLKQYLNDNTQALKRLYELVNKLNESNTILCDEIKTLKD